MLSSVYGVLEGASDDKVEGANGLGARWSCVVVCYVSLEAAFH